jgi:pilus assembly protein CpaB
MSRLSGVAYALRGGDAVDVLVSLLVVDIDTGFQSILPNLSVLLVDTEKRPVVAEVNPEVKEEGERGEDSTAPRLKSVGRGETEPSTGELIFNIPSEAQRPRLVTQRLVENATVLSVGTFPLEDAIAGPQVIIPEEGEGGAQAEQAVAEPQPPDIITLIVSPQDALAINYAMKSGIIDITLTLRAPDDVTEFETSAVSLEYLVSNYRITVPTKLPYGLFPRQDRFVPPSLPNESPGPAQ